MRGEEVFPKFGENLVSIIFAVGEQAWEFFVIYVRGGHFGRPLIPLIWGIKITGNNPFV